MKKYLLGIAVLLMGTAVMTSCSDDDDAQQTYLQAYSTGAYVVNAGAMYSSIESSLTFIDYASNTATQKVFSAANGRSLGNTANDGIVYGSKIYIAVDQSNTIEVIDKTTRKSLKQINTTSLMGTAEGNEPRHIISSDGKVYFTTYGGYVAAIDTTSYQLQAKYQVGSYPEGLAAGHGSIYVANSNYGQGGGTLSCINLASGQVETKTIEGVNNPIGIFYTAGTVYVSDNQYYDASYHTLGENTLRQVDFENGTSQKVADGNYAALYSPAVATRTDVISSFFYVLNAPYGSTSPSVSIYSPGSTGAQKIDISEMPASPCGIFADPLTGHFFILSYKMGDYGYADYNGDGYVVEYNYNGEKLHEYSTGVGQCAMFFDSAYKTEYVK